MKIGILGTGNVGTTLGKTWARQGHEVIFGVRDPNADKVKTLLSELGNNASAAIISTTASLAEVVALTVPWEAVPEVLQQTGDLDRKICLDCTNPLVANQLHQTATLATSGGEQVAAWLPKARVVKIFNTVGWEIMANPQYGNETATMFYAGDDAEAKAIAAQLARDVGFDPIDAGGLSSAVYLESLAGFWGELVYGQGMGRGIGWRLLK
jgi:8-hydroxy-5-deazaflavin:NADPH oxidoreductase